MKPRICEMSSGNPDPLRPIRHLNPQMSPAVDDLLMQALQLNQNERPSSAKDMRHALQKATQPVAPPKPTRQHAVAAKQPTKPVSQPVHRARPTRQPVHRAQPTRQPVSPPQAKPRRMNTLVIGLVVGVLFGCFGGSILFNSAPAEPQIVIQTVIVEKEVEVEVVVTRIVTPSSQP